MSSSSFKNNAQNSDITIINEQNNFQNMINEQIISLIYSIDLISRDVKKLLTNQVMINNEISSLKSIVEQFIQGAKSESYNVSSYNGRKFPVIAVGDQILNGCVIRTIALASLRFRAELVQEEVLRPEELLVAGSLFLQLAFEMGVQIIGRDVNHGRCELLIEPVHRVHEGGFPGAGGPLEEQAGADGTAHHPFGDLLDFGADLFPGDILEFDAAGLDGLAVDLAERFHQRLFFHSLYLSRKFGDKVIPCREYRILHKN